ncbi:hypothetical protein BB559_000605 [Furculomyces boomerangus]|uniref:Aminotransferase class I/classII large domain-containing protein n=1 Tax=Furculomyces boomerangus TaxID=61424 RepID=A0A2T9Z4V2_9FUNG|nr:hypothetical protein BB559_000605 [Furculomyces boomerangus]
MQKDNEKGLWDTKIQQYHGGQEWKHLDNFVEDFSVTTNALGTPKAALLAAQNAILDCGHYPPANQEPAKTSLAKFIWPSEYVENNKRLILGNGASELIDLVMRMAPAGKWKPGPFKGQYKEYERSALNCNMELLSNDSKEKANVVCLVNPCNPTGDYLQIDQLISWVSSNVLDGGFVIVDESMQPWRSKDFRENSLTSKTQAISELFSQRGVSVYIIHSWTKLWCCTGLRLGSIICPNESSAMTIKKYQVPWSVNYPALAFLDSVTSDTEYLNETWKVTPEWRLHSVEKLSEKFPSWTVHGEPFLSWLWVDTKSQETAEKAVSVSRIAGVPIRSGLPGYNMPTFIRIAVREPSKFQILLDSFNNI